MLRTFSTYKDKNEWVIFSGRDDLFFTVDYFFPRGGKPCFRLIPDWQKPHGYYPLFPSILQPGAKIRQPGQYSTKTVGFYFFQSRESFRSTRLSGIIQTTATAAYMAMPAQGCQKPIRMPTR